jgi:hypothetical protein
VEGIYETILMKWIADLNNGIDHLAFESQKTKIGHKLGNLTQG